MVYFHMNIKIDNHAIIHLLAAKRKGKSKMSKKSVTPRWRSDCSAVVGIICEYNPFHRGHARQFQLIREQLPGAAIVGIMSGPFTQRGMPALYAPAQRVRAALNAGADVMLELPALFALREGEGFALGGVSILQALGFVTHLSFGCETEDLPVLEAAAETLERQGEPFRLALKSRLEQGLSFAAAQGMALAQLLGADPALLAGPNNTLAISYLRALHRLGSPIRPLPVLRQGGYHETSLGPGLGYPSATAVRAALAAGEWAAAKAACGYGHRGLPCHPEKSLDALLLYRLRAMSHSQLAALPDCTEGLQNRLYAACREAVNRQELLARLKTRRYTYARLSRLCCHGLLGITARLQEEYPLPAYARLLGFHRQSQGLLSRLRYSGIPVIAKAAQGPATDPACRLDAQAYDLWALGAGQPAGLMYRQGMVVEG